MRDLRLASDFRAASFDSVWSGLWTISVRALGNAASFQKEVIRHAMKNDADAGIPTLRNALFDYMNSDDLKKLGALTKQELPSRKDDRANLILRYLDGNGLQSAWQHLDELQRAAVAEVVHSEETYFPADLFHAKYGRSPVWESNEENRYYRKPSPLCFFNL